MMKRMKKKKKIKREFNGSSQEDYGNTDLDHDINLSFSDGNAL